MKPLDFVKTQKGNIALITEIEYFDGISQASIEFLEGNVNERSAWWYENELEVINSLPLILSLSLCHQSGQGRENAENSFPLNKGKEVDK